MFPEAQFALRFDTAESLEINPSFLKPCGQILAAICLLFPAGMWMIKGGAIDSKYGEATIVFGWIACTYIAMAAACRFLYLLQGDRATLKLSPGGLSCQSDILIVIPWSAVVDVSKLRVQRRTLFQSYSLNTSTIQLKLQSDNYQKPTNMARATRLFWFKFFAEPRCVYISSTSYQASYADLYTAIYAYARTHNPALGARS